MVLQGDVLEDLRREGDELAWIVADLSDEEWSRPTPAAGWSVAHQIAHLAWTDDLALIATRYPDAFDHEAGTQRSQAENEGRGLADWAADRRARTSPSALLSTWESSRTRLAEALAGVPERTRLPWFGPPMSAVSMATARLMETWAHGQDVCDALGRHRAPTNRLRHVAHLGVRTRDFAYRINHRTPPDEPVRVELIGPGEQLWTWGDEHAAQRVTGSALDFCLLVCQRRHPDDLSLIIDGDQAREWMTLAQAFAGAPGPGRRPTNSTTTTSAGVP